MRRALLLLPSLLFGLDREPWFTNMWEFNFRPKYTYSYYPSVQGAIQKHQTTSHDNFLTFDLGVCPLDSLSVDVDLEFADTPIQKMGYRSSAVQARYQWLDDIVGDFATITTGAIFRGVSRHGLKDPSCPYHSDVNGALNFSIGKEWDKDQYWTVRMFGYGAGGIANHGSCFAHYLVSIQTNTHNHHRFGLFNEGYFGFGHKESLNIDRFHGYASIHHQSLDVGIRYSYVFPIWGHFTLMYTRRVYAKLFPQDVNFFTMSYTLPFSFF
jgi:hypothetical protein